MSYIENSRLANADMQRRMDVGAFVRTPSIMETVELAFDETRMTEVFGSQVRQQDHVFGPDKARIRQMVEEGAISPEEMDSFTRRKRRGGEVDWEGLGDYLNETQGEDFDFSRKRLEDTIGAESEERQVLMDNVQGWSNVALFAGTLGALATDPINVATAVAPLSGFGGVGKTMLSTVSKVAFREAGIESGIEAVNQMNVYDVRNRLGMEYGIGDAAANILAAATLAGTISSGVQMLRRSLIDANTADLLEGYDKALLPSLREAAEANPADLRAGVLIEETQAARDFYASLDQGAPAIDAERTYQAHQRTMARQEATPVTDRARAAADNDANIAQAVDMDNPEPQFIQELPDDTPLAATINDEGDLVLSNRTMKEYLEEADANLEEFDLRSYDFEECVRG